MAVLSTSASHRRMLSTVAALARTWAGVRFSAAGKSLVCTPSRANALRVASMLRWMYGSSRCSSWGVTWRRCTNAGTSPPINTEDNTSSSVPATGRVKSRERKFRKNSTAHTGATTMSSRSAGSWACTSV
jgi:hypothetical protein